MKRLLTLLSLWLGISAGVAAPLVVTERPTFRISSTQQVLFVYTGNIIVAIVAVTVVARILMACFGICCVGNQERIYYREVLNHVFSLSTDEIERREPIDSIKHALRCAGEYLSDREQKCLAALSGQKFKAPMAVS